MTHRLVQAVDTTTQRAADRYVTRAVFWSVLIIAAIWVPGDSLEAQTQPTESSNESVIVEDSKTGERPPTPASDEPFIPDFHICRVHLESVKSDPDRMWLDATVDISVNQDVGWLRIPLRFEQAQITQRTYTGPGAESPDPESRVSEKGQNWWIQGKGQHSLVFRMWVPIQKTVKGSQLTLSLPALPSQFVATAKLDLPAPNAVVVDNPNGMIVKPVRNSESTEIETTIGKSRLDLTWIVPEPDSKAIPFVSTDFQLNPTSEDLVVIADQKIELPQLPPKEVRVQLPQDFAFDEVTGTVYSSEDLIPDAEGWVSIPLPEDVSRSFVLRWILRRSIGDIDEEFDINGLIVDGAIRQEGHVIVNRTKDYQLLLKAAKSDRIYQIESDRSRIETSGAESTTFRFVRQPFRLVHQVVRNRPIFSVTPIYELNVDRDAIEMSVHHLVKLDRGELRSLRLKWDAAANSSWEILESFSSDPSFRRLVHTFDPVSEDLVLVGERAISGPSRFVVTTKFVKLSGPTDGSEFEIPLPQINAFMPEGGFLTIQSSDETEVELSDTLGENFQETTLDNILTAFSDRWDLPGSFTTGVKNLTAHQIRSTNQNKIRGWTTFHDREVIASTSVEVTDVTPDRIRLHQSLQLQVAYGSLKTLKLAIPDEFLAVDSKRVLQESLEIRLDGVLQAVDFSSETFDVQLPTLMTGRIEIETDYAVPVTPGKRDFHLPILAFSEFPFSSAKCLVIPYESVQVESETDDWEAVETSPRGPVWMITEPVGELRSIPIKIGRGLNNAMQHYRVDEMFLFTEYQLDGTSFSSATLQVRNPPTRIVLNLPTGAMVRSVWVDSTELPATKFLQESHGLEELTIQLPPRPDEQREIRIRYQSPRSESFGYANQHQFQFPQLPKSVWIQSTIWELRLPEGFHLFTNPSLQSQFLWSWNGLGWSRQPTESFQLVRQRQWGEVGAFQSEKNAYPFRSFSPVDSVQFRAMNRSLILLFGAGLTLSLGFMFHRFPETRNVSTLVAIAFVFAVVSIWYLQPLLLLLQPAAIGAGLAMAATLFGNRSTTRDAKSRSSIRVPRLSPQGTHEHGEEANPTQIYIESGSHRSQMSGGSG